ncbi:alcohol oxidase, partial [Aureobasidium melanogenum]
MGHSPEVVPDGSKDDPKALSKLIRVSPVFFAAGARILWASAKPESLLGVENAQRRSEFASSIEILRLWGFEEALGIQSIANSSVWRPKRLDVCGSSTHALSNQQLAPYLVSTLKDLAVWSNAGATVPSDNDWLAHISTPCRELTTLTSRIELNVSDLQLSNFFSALIHLKSLHVGSNTSAALGEAALSAIFSLPKLESLVLVHSISHDFITHLNDHVEASMILPNIISLTVTFLDGVAYLDPVLNRPNLTVFTDALMQKLIIEDGSSGPIVRGVSYSKHGVLHRVSARREVILAAGTFNTPQILDLSGIGNPSILGEHGIDVVYANSAVGENLQDHMRSGLSFEVTNDVPARRVTTEKDGQEYKENRSGLLGENGAFMFSYTPLAPFLDQAGHDDLEDLLDKHLIDDGSWSSFERKCNNFIRNAIKSSDEVTAVSFLSRAPYVESEGGNFISLNSMLSHPFSAGNVHITSADPHTKPKIDFNYHSHPLDVEIHARHMQALDKLAKTEPMASYLVPGRKRLPKAYSEDTIEDYKEVARVYAKTNYHPCGTCSLGTVVDSRLNVIGLRNLRIVDASIMPIIPRGNILATVYAVAERAADIISEDLKLERQK